MNITEAFPSAFLKCEDLQGKSVTVTIDSVKQDEIGQGNQKAVKLIIGFTGRSKKLVCNKTNAKTIAKLYGPETENWIGQKIILRPLEVEFSGDMVWSIRVSLQKPGGIAEQGLAAQTVTEPATAKPNPDSTKVEPEDVPF